MGTDSTGEKRSAPLLVILALVVGCSGAGPRAPAGVREATLRGVPARSCFLLFELGVGEVRRAPASGCSTRIPPESTFKIPHALAALDSGVIASPDTVLRYDGAATPFVTWRRDHTLASAIHYSVVWYFQRVADLLGPERESDYARRLGYGNEDTSAPQRRFWIDGSLRISPDEQEKFLIRLYEGKLPVSTAAMQGVRDSLVQPPGMVVNATGEHPFAKPWPADAVLSAKTGSDSGPWGEIRWLVGHVRRGPRSWVFVSCVTGGREVEPLAAVDLAAKNLQAEQAGKVL